MLVKYHILAGFLLSLLIFFMFPQIGWFYALVIFLSSVLIDFDHYLFYAIRFRDLSLKRAHCWFLRKSRQLRAMSVQERRKYKFIILIFHGIECWIIVALLISLHKIFLFILIGFMVHMVLDFIDLFIWKMPFYIKISQIYNYKKNKKGVEFR